MPPPARQHSRAEENDSGAGAAPQAAEGNFPSARHLPEHEGNIPVSAPLFRAVAPALMPAWRWGPALPAASVSQGRLASRRSLDLADCSGYGLGSWLVFDGGEGSQLSPSRTICALFGCRQRLSTCCTGQADLSLPTLVPEILAVPRLLFMTSPEQRSSHGGDTELYSANE